MKKNHEDIVVYQYYDNTFDANIAKTKLDAYGIPCFLTEENMSNLYPGQSLYAFKIRLHIFAADRERAVEILMQESDAEEVDQSVRCPRCQSHRVIREFPKRLADQLTYIFFGVLFPHKKVSHCLDCDCEF